MSHLPLLGTRRFAPLFVVQFLGAFNDNVFKNTLAIMLTFHAIEWTSLPAALLAPLIGGIFILPFFLFSGSAGSLADTHDKASLARMIKFFELILMALATMGFLFHSFSILLIVLFGMGTHSTFFGPIKYAIIPQHVHPEELIGANALIESGTFIAILLGTITGGVLLLLSPSGLLSGVISTLLALLGYRVSHFIPPAPPAQNLPWRFEPFRDTLSTLSLARQHPSLTLVILAISWFWLYGAFLLSQFPSLVQILLHADERLVTVMLTLFTLGVAAGSMMCELGSHRYSKEKLLLIGAQGLGVSGLLFGWMVHDPSELVMILICLVAIGFFGGIYSVPLYTLLQDHAAPSYRSRIIAANNISNAFFMVLSSLLTMFLLKQGWSIPELFFGLGLGNMLVVMWIAQNRYFIVQGDQ